MAFGTKEGKWVRLSCGNGAKGLREYEWVRYPIHGSSAPQWLRWLLIRRHPDEKEDVAYYIVYAPKSSPLLFRSGGRFSLGGGTILSGSQRRSGAGSLRGSFMDGMVSTHHLGYVCSCLFNRITSTRNSIRTSKKGEWFLPELDCFQTQLGTVISLTVPEVRRLLEKVLWQRIAPVIHFLAWSYWRRRHQAIAQFHHYRKRMIVT